jgi:hypothetical protein
MGKLIYIASPYNHEDDSVRIENYKKVSNLAAHLVSKGNVALSPITYGHNLLDFCEMPYDWKFWSNFCLTFLSRCDELWVYKMDGWDKSRGVQEEIDYALQYNITIKFIDYERMD